MVRQEKHIDVAAVRDFLQGLLDAEAARIGLLAVAVVFGMLRPVGEAALAEAAHAIRLIGKHNALADDADHAQGHMAASAWFA